MREILIGEKLVRSGDRIEDSLSCLYHILVHVLPPPVACESYGVRITVEQTGEQEEISDITVRAERIEELAGLLFRGGVTPCALRDVVADWL